MSFQQQKYVLFTNISNTLQTLELSEWCMILLPPILYWIFSLFFFILSKLQIKSIEKYKIPVNATKDKVSFHYVLAIVAIQHLIQIAVGLSLVIATKSEKPVESAPLFILKLYLAALIFDTYEVCHCIVCL